MRIRLEDVSSRFRAGESDAESLRNVSLEVARGEYVAILGPSGAGKSALLEVIGGLVRPSAGACSLGSVRIDALTDDELARLRGRRIGFVFARALLLPELSALENVELPLVYQAVAPAERRERAAGILGEVGLGSRLHRRPGELSACERQRTAIARACVSAPGLLLADEPAQGLDARAGDEIMELLEARNAQGVTLVVATHDAAKGRRARRLVQMRDGRVVRELAGGIRFGARGALVRRLRGRARRR